jgi:hypothetical protein
VTEPVVKKYPKSGHCNLGHHEGTKPKSPSGQPHKTCDQLEWCSCECHKQIDQMYALAGKPRVLKVNPDYVPFVRTFWMPSPEETLKEIASIAPIKYDAPEAPTIEPTVAGRTNKGMLEYWVKEVIEFWLTEQDRPLLTCVEISERIQKNHDLEKLPSAGAVDSVLRRWEAIGYAMVGRGPVRFLGKTREGNKEGLDALKAKAKLNG